jgi:membrane protein DedA with SNARE-associated domain
VCYSWDILLSFGIGASFDNKVIRETEKNVNIRKSYITNAEASYEFLEAVTVVLLAYFPYFQIR